MHHRGCTLGRKSHAFIFFSLHYIPGLTPLDMLFSITMTCYVKVMHCKWSQCCHKEIFRKIMSMESNTFHSDQSPWWKRVLWISRDCLAPWIIYQCHQLISRKRLKNNKRQLIHFLKKKKKIEDVFQKLIGASRIKILPWCIPSMALDYSSYHLHEEAYSSPQTESGLQMFLSQ